MQRDAARGGVWPEEKRAKAGLDVKFAICEDFIGI